MGSENVVKSVEELVAPLAQSEGAIVEKVTLSGRGNNQTLALVVDLAEGTESISSDQIATLTRAFSRVLDDADPIDGAYILEVSSPGAERALTEVRHYQRALTKNVLVALQNETVVEGTLSEVGDASITVVGADGSHVIAFEDVASARPVAQVTKEA